MADVATLVDAAQIRTKVRREDWVGVPALRGATDGDDRVCRALLDRGADVDEGSHNGENGSSSWESTLRSAAHEGHIEVGTTMPRWSSGSTKALAGRVVYGRVPADRNVLDDRIPRGADANAREDIMVPSREAPCRPCHCFAAANESMPTLDTDWRLP